MPVRSEPKAWLHLSLTRRCEVGGSPPLDDKSDVLDKEKFDFVAARNRTDAMIMGRLPHLGDTQ